MGNWDEGRKDALRRMWLEGSSSRQIAHTLGGVTRNAVMGMANRMGLLRSAEHNSASTARRTGCCSSGWSRDGARPPKDVVTQIAVDPIGQPSPIAGPEPVGENAAVAADPASTIDLVAPADARLEAVPESPAISEPAVAASGEKPVVKARRLPAKPAARAPSSRAWRRLSDEARIPSNQVDFPPPPKVVISSGVMSGLGSLQPGTSQWSDVFAALKDLTGVPYDERVPGHAPALVAIATVVARGDPRRVLSPVVPEQAVLRFMRRFADKGLVVAGKPPAHWFEDVDDRAFFEEMVQLSVA